MLQIRVSWENRLYQEFYVRQPISINRMIVIAIILKGLTTIKCMLLKPLIIFCISTLNMLTMGGIEEEVEEESSLLGVVEVKELLLLLRRKSSFL